MTTEDENIKVSFNNKHFKVYTPKEYIRIVDTMLGEKDAAFPFTTDSKDYYVIQECAENVKDVPGLFCEIGFRAGGGTKFMMNGIVRTKQRRTCIAIDPFGSMPYEGMDGETTIDHDFNRFVMHFTLKTMYDYVQWCPNINFVFFPLEDTEFFNRYADGVPLYQGGKKETVNKYALVHLDGPHTTEVVLNETKFFHERTIRGSMLVYDDVEFFYDHEAVEKFLFENGWVRIHKTDFKASYVRGCDD